MTKKTESKELVVAQKATPVTGKLGSVKVGDKYLEPIHTFTKVDKETDLVYEGVTLLNKQSINRMNVEGPLYLYKHEVPLEDHQSSKDQVVMYFLLDNTSIVDMVRDGYYRPLHNANTDVVVLLDSSSFDDTFIGSVVLRGVNSKRGNYTSSVIDNAPRHSNHFRMELEYVFAYHLTHRGNSLPRGTYVESELNWVTFDSKAGDVQVWIAGSELTDVSLSSNKININKSYVVGCRFPFEGPITLGRTHLKHKYLPSPIPSFVCESLYDFTEIDIAGKDPAIMARIDEDNVTIVLPGKLGTLNQALLTMSFRNPNSRRSLRHRAMEAFFGNVEPSEIEESVIDYLVDTILSRVKMIGLVDDARRLLDKTLMGVKEKPTLEEGKVDHLAPYRRKPWGSDPNAFGMHMGKDTGNTIYVSGDDLE